MTRTFNEVLARLDRADVAITIVARPPQRVSYAELASRIYGNAQHFGAQGVRPGDRVAIAMENDLEHVVALLALVAMGATPLSVKPRRGPVEEYAEHIAKLCGLYHVRFAYGALPVEGAARRIAWAEDARSDDASVVAEVDPEAIAFVQFSSGSLGAPKAVPITHAMLVNNLGSQAMTDGRVAETMGYNFLPLSHDMGLVGGLLGAIWGQHPLALSSVQEFLRRPTEVFRGVEQEKSLVVPMPDFAIRYLARHLAGRSGRSRSEDARLLSCVKTIYCGAEPIRRKTIAEFLEVAPSFGFDPRSLVFSYGLAEATLLVSAHSFASLPASFAEAPNDRVIANVGKPCDPRLELRIGPAGSAEGVEGPVWIRGPSVFRGYLDAAPLVDGWYDTGDVGFVRGGDLFLSGRTKDLIIVNGENMFPSDIEDAVAGMPGVEEPLVMTEDDRFFLLVVPSSAKAGVDARAVAAEVAARFGAAPSGVAVGPARSILRTTSGKPMRDATLAELRRAGMFEPAGHGSA